MPKTWRSLPVSSATCACYYRPVPVRSAHPPAADERKDRLGRRFYLDPEKDIRVFRQSDIVAGARKKDRESAVSGLVCKKRGGWVGKGGGE